MSDYDNENKGALFPNDKKTNSKQPALRGFMNLNGVDYWASAWRKISSDTGLPYISIALQEKDVEDPETINGELHQDPDRKSDKAPNFKGVIHFDENTEIDIVSWVKVRAATGTNFFSILVDANEGGSGGNGDKIDDSDIFFGLGSSMEAPQEPDFDDDIPF